jgi:hypothetical protein
MRATVTHRIMSSMITSAPSSPVLLLSVTGTAAQAGSDSPRIRRYRLARVRRDGRPVEAKGSGAANAAAKPLG